MPTVPSSKLEDIAKSQRKKFQELSFERCVLGFSFSYKRLSRLLSTEEIRSCIIGFKSEQTKEITEVLNDQISTILATNNLPTSEKGGITLTLEDPFGIMRNVILMNSTSTSFKVQDACQFAVSRLGITAEQFMEAIQFGTKKTPFTTVQVRAANEKEGG